MVSQEHRFHGRNSLRFLFNRGQTIRTEFFVLRHVANKRRRNFRLAVVVAKKVDKKSVIRNRIRRRLYELFRIRFSDADLRADMAIIVLSNSLAEMPGSQLRKIFKPVFEKILTRHLSAGSTESGRLKN